MVNGVHDLYYRYVSCSLASGFSFPSSYFRFHFIFPAIVWF